ncbi:hypothetical protein C2E23DRAFT_723372, partial [Lenzites betulinus]
SPAYDHFKAPVVLPPKADGTVMYRFVCKRHPSKHVDRADYEDSTGNLKRHISGCDPEDVPEVELITAYAQGTSYSGARLRFYIVMWCARHHRPFAIVEDAEFRQLLEMLYAKTEIPKRMTVARDMRMIHAHCKDRVSVYLKVTLFSLFYAIYAVLTSRQALDGGIHLCIDGWTSPNILAFLGITAHWHENGEIRHIILDFVR